MMSASPELFKRVQAVRSNGTTRGGSRKSHTHVQMTAALFSAFLLFHSVKKPLGGRPWRVRAEPAEIGGGRNPAAGYKSLRELCEKAHLSGAGETATRGGTLKGSARGALLLSSPGQFPRWRKRSSEPGHKLASRNEKTCLIFFTQFRQVFLSFSVYHVAASSFSSAEAFARMPSMSAPCASTPSAPIRRNSGIPRTCITCFRYIASGSSSATMAPED